MYAKERERARVFHVRLDRAIIIRRFIFLYYIFFCVFRLSSALFCPSYAKTFDYPASMSRNCVTETLAAAPFVPQVFFFELQT